jgi:hypothetical protein
MLATAWRRLSHRDGLHDDDANPRREHAEAVAQWQSQALRLMWAAAFGLALWHSSDSVVCGRRIGRKAAPYAADLRLDNCRAQNPDARDSACSDFRHTQRQS